MIYLFHVLGLASFAGVLLMVVLIPVTSFLKNKSKAKETIKIKQQDSRVKTINEFLNGIKVVKLYAWEMSFNLIINKIKTSELNTLKYISYINGLFGFSLNIMPFLV